MGADDALAVLESKTQTRADRLPDGSYKYTELESLTTKGDSKDATSIVNMQATIKFLKECNELRSNADNADKNLPELKVTLINTAYAMWDVNWNYEHVEHARVFNVGENVSWGYSDPFDGWYHEEKALYDKDNNTDKAGHYHNILRDWDRTGYAINSHGPGGGAHSQVFSWSSWGENAGAKAYTVDEYEKLLGDWIDAQKKAPAEYQAKLAALKAAQGEAQAAADALKSKQAAQTSAQADLDAANSAAQAAADETAQKAAAVESAKQDVASAETNLEAAKGGVEKAQAAVNAAQVLASM